MVKRAIISAHLVALAVLLVLPREAHASAKLYDITIFLNELRAYQRGGRIVPPPAPTGVAPAPAPIRPVAPPPPRAAPAPPVWAPSAGPSRLRGWYIDVALGFAAVADADVSDSWLGTNGTLTADFGYGIGLAVGHEWGNSLRADVEVVYRTSDLDKITTGGFGLAGSSTLTGSVSSLGVLVNGYYDFDLDWPVDPYVGAGLGFARVEVDSATLPKSAGADTVLAYQLATGFKYPVGERAALRFGYKFFATADPTIDDTESEYMTHNIEFGLVFDF